MAYRNPDLFLDIASRSAAPSLYRAPVRRNSVRAGHERGFYRPMRRGDVRILMRAAERLELNARAKGCRNGPIGHVGLEVYRELIRVFDYRTGRLEPCYAGIAARIRRARSAVVEAMARLRAAGLVDWVRRYAETDARGEAGPQVKQISNAYRLCVPAFLRQALGVFTEAPPIPEDEEDRRRDHTRNQNRWMLEDSPLFSALQRLGRAIEKRETAEGSEPPAT